MPEKKALPIQKFSLSMLDSEDFKKKIQRAIPETLRVDRVIQLAYTLLKNDGALMQCTPLSILSSVASAAQLGLELDRNLGHAYLVRFGDECQLVIGYRGFMHLMYQSGAVIAVSSEIVRAGEKFRRTLGTDRGLYHVPGPTPKQDDSETWQGAYAVAKMVTGNSEFEYMDAAHIISNRNRSKSWQKWKKEGKSTIWITDPEEMWRKTPIRRLAKRMPQSVTDRRGALLRAAMLDEYAEKRGLLIPTETGWEVNPNPPDDESTGEEPLSPTMEQQLQESIEHVEERKAQVAKKNKPVPPKAEVPKIDDAYLSSKQQAEVFNAAAQAGWKVPEELTQYIKKTFKLNSIREVRQSQFDGLMRAARGEK